MNKKILIIISLSFAIIFSGLFFTNNAEAASAVVVTTPNGGENIIKGQDYVIWWNINWMPSDADNKVDIYYRQATGPNQLIVEGVTSQNSSYGYYNWSVPSTLEDGNYWIVIVAQGSGTELFDESNASFNILSSSETPAISLILPNGGEKLGKNSTYTINWNTIGTVPNVSISLEDSNNYVQTIINNIPNTDSYNWTISSSLASGQYKIRVSGTDYSSASDISSDVFYIYDSNDVTPPSKPFNTRVDKNSDSDPDYKLIFDYTTPSDADYYCINIYRSTSYYTLGTKVLNCVNKNTKPGANTGYSPYEDDYIASLDSGNVYFSIRAVDIAGNESVWSAMDQKTYTWTSNTINLLSPNGGEEWRKGKTYLIYWTSTNTNLPIDLNLVDENGMNQWILNSKSGISEYSWTVPTSITPGRYKIRINYTNYGNTRDLSSDYFNIVEDTSKIISLSSPVSASTYWQQGSDQIIFWSSLGFNNPVCDIELYQYGSASLYKTIVEDRDSVNSFDRYSWTVSSDIAPGEYKIRLKCHDYGSSEESISDSDDTLNITKYFNIIKSEAIDPPINISVSRTETDNGTKLRISWTNPNDTSAIVYRSTAFGELGNRIISTLSDDTYTIDENVNPNTMYYYTVHSGKEGNESTNTDQYSGSINDYIQLPPEPTPTPTPTPEPTQALPNGTLIKLPDDPKIYVIKDGKKQWIRTAEQFQQQGYQWSDVQETDSNVISAYDDYLQAAANLIRATNQAKVYKIIDNKRLWIPTAESFARMGNNWSDIQDINESEVNQYPQLKLARLANSHMVYYLTENGSKRHIPTAEAFNSYNYNWTDIVEVSSDIINSYEDNTLIMMEGDYKVYSLVNSIRQWIKTDEAFNRLNYNKSKIEKVSRTELFSYAEEGYIE